MVRSGLEEFNPVPMGDLVTARHYLGTNNIEVFMRADGTGAQDVSEPMPARNRPKPRLGAVRVGDADVLGGGVLGEAFGAALTSES
jgi:hypothetical protein